MVPNSRTERAEFDGTHYAIGAAVDDQGRQRGPELGVGEGKPFYDVAYRVDSRVAGEEAAVVSGHAPAVEASIYGAEQGSAAIP